MRSRRALEKPILTQERLQDSGTGSQLKCIIKSDVEHSAGPRYRLRIRTRSSNSQMTVKTHIRWAWTWRWLMKFTFHRKVMTTLTMISNQTCASSTWLRAKRRRDLKSSNLRLYQRRAPQKIASLSGTKWSRHAHRRSTSSWKTWTKEISSIW